MKRTKYALLIFAFLALAAGAVHSQPQSLAGTWRFRLDPDNKGLSEGWFSSLLPDAIELPGSCEQRGFGRKNNPPDSNRLTRTIRYEGKAWYQRTIEIPATRKGRRWELFLERCHWESSVWLDGKPCGTQNSLSTPHLYDLGVPIPGTHTLTICIDNTYGKLPIGSWGFAITDDTQGNWNGMIGRMELRSTDLVWIREVQVHAGYLQVKIGNATGEPHEAILEAGRSMPQSKRATAGRTHAAAESSYARTKNKHASAEGGQVLAGNGRRAAGKQHVVIPVTGTVIHMPFKPAGLPWDEFRPLLDSLTLTLSCVEYSDTKTVSYGLREWKTRQGQFVLNGRPVLMRGPVNECVYPLTGYPPMDREAWRRVLGICQSYGFNFMRFNSWCPPEAAFQAADELGMFLQVELPFWSIFAPLYGEHPARDQFLGEELERILENYGNHPSFAFMAMGNESPGPFETLVNRGRKLDNRMLYRCQNGDSLANGDYAERGTEIGQRGVKGPRTDWDRWSLWKGTDSKDMQRQDADRKEADRKNPETNDIEKKDTDPKDIEGKGRDRKNLERKAAEEKQQEIDRYRLSPLPTFAHEVGQWASYPDFDQLIKFTGTLKPYNYEIFRNSLAKHNMLQQNKDFARASGTFAVSLYKEEIEGCLRTWPYGGFQIVEARDFPGEGGAIIGWLDAFWDSKGLITPEEFRRFCAPVVCLLRMPKRIYTREEPFQAEAELSNYGPGDLSANAASAWKIEDEKGRIIARGAFPAGTIKTGRVGSLGTIHASLEKAEAPCRLQVTVSSSGVANSWNIWVYPDRQPQAPAPVRISYAFDTATRETLANGGKVVLFSSPKQGLVEIQSAFMGPADTREFPPVSKGRSALPGSYMPAFWNMRLFNQTGTLGILCDPRHPALAGFPTESHSDWQWADLLGRFTAEASYVIAGDTDPRNWGDASDRSKSIILNETPPGYRPIVQMIDNYERNYKLGLIFETRVGKGKLLICALDLDTDAAKRPAARQLKTSLLNYAAGERFNPDYELPAELLERILTY